MRRGGFFFPVALILVGAVLLLSNFGILSDNIWPILWPTLLILLGISVIAGGIWRRETGESRSLSIPEEGAEAAEIRIEYGAGELAVHGNAQVGALLSGTFTGGVEPNIERRAGKTMIHLDATINNPFDWGERRAWSVGLSQNIATELRVEGGAADMRFDLTRTKVSRFDLQTGASSVEIQLPENAGETRLDIHGGATAINIKVPSEVAATIRIDGGLSSQSVDTHRFPKSGSGWQSKNYDKAKNKVDIRVELGAGSVSIS